MKLRFLIVTTVITLAMTTTAFAKKKDENFTREEIEQEFYTQYWKDSAVGTENPEGSLEWHILQQFLDEQYPHRQSEGKQYVVADWKDDYYIDQAWRDYHEEYMKGWDLQDDDGKMVIWEEDPETGDNIRPLYTFKLLDGMWNLIDSNGNVYDTFEPHGGDGSWQELLEEDDEDRISKRFASGSVIGDDENTNSKTNVDPDELQEAEEQQPIVDEDGVAVPAGPRNTENDQPVSADDKNGSRVTGKKATSVSDEPMVDDEITETKNTNEKEEKNSSILWILLIAIIIIAALSFIYFRKAGSKNDNKK